MEECRFCLEQDFTSNIHLKRKRKRKRKGFISTTCLHGYMFIWWRSGGVAKILAKWETL
jgi:hypothetical protein